jgi:hypothetical protein
MCQITKAHGAIIAGAGDENPAFGKAMVGAWYETLAVMQGDSDKAKAAINQMRPLMPADPCHAAKINTNKAKGLAHRYTSLQPQALAAVAKAAACTKAHMTGLSRFCSMAFKPHKPALTANTQVAASPHTMPSMNHKTPDEQLSSTTNHSMAHRCTAADCTG